MRIVDIYFTALLITQLLIVMNIKYTSKKYLAVLISLLNLGLGFLFFWNNAILIDETGQNGSSYSFCILIMSCLVFIITFFYPVEKNQVGDTND